MTRTSQQLESIWAPSATRKLRVYAGQHRHHRSLDVSKFLRIARAHHNVGVGAALLIHKGIGADDDVRMRFGDA